MKRPLAMTRSTDPFERITPVEHIHRRPKGEVIPCHEHIDTGPARANPGAGRPGGPTSIRK